VLHSSHKRDDHPVSEVEDLEESLFGVSKAEEQSVDGEGGIRLVQQSVSLALGSCENSEQ
jgi:hypothetical protein